MIKKHTPQEEEKIREEFRKAVIMGCHPGKTYEEALEEEIDFAGCVVVFKEEVLNARLRRHKTDTVENFHSESVWKAIKITSFSRVFYSCDHCLENLDIRAIKNLTESLCIWGRPISLSMVMAAIESQRLSGRTKSEKEEEEEEEEGYYWWRYIFTLQGGFHLYGNAGLDDYTNVCNWQLLKEDGSEATAEDQSIVTISKLLPLLLSN